jgi:stringent starvation protein B
VAKAGQGGAEAPPLFPYLVRAVHGWIVDQGLTPYLAANVFYPGVSIPLDYAEDGHIVLNVSPTATRGLELGEEGIFFSARFGGVPNEVWVPYGSLQALYARENQEGVYVTEEGVLFSARVLMPVHPDAAGSTGTAKSSGKKTPSPLRSVDAQDAGAGDEDPDPTTPPSTSPTAPSGGRPSLRVVK